MFSMDLVGSGSVSFDTDPDSGFSHFLIRIRIQGNYMDSTDPDPPYLLLINIIFCCLFSNELPRLGCMGKSITITQMWPILFAVLHICTCRSYHRIFQRKVKYTKNVRYRPSDCTVERAETLHSTKFSNTVTCDRLLRCTIEPVGSCATLVAERILADNPAFADRTAFGKLHR